MPAKKPVLLCVDDDPKCLEVRSLLFEALGFKVVSSEQPKEGLRLFQRKRFDAAVIDFQMPEMNGAELAREMKQARADVPIVIVSGLPELPQDTPAYYDRFFCKTISGQQLAHEIRSLVGSYSAQKEPAPRRLVATSALALGILTESVSDLAHRRKAPVLNLKGVSA